MSTQSPSAASVDATKPLGQLEVWLAVGSQDLYGPEVLAEVDRHAAQIAAHLDESATIPVRVVAKPVLRDAGSIKAICVAANADDRCAGLILWMHTFSPAKMWIAGLTALSKPVLHLHTQFNRDLPWSEIDMDFMNLNQSAHGDREFGHLAARMKLRRKTVAGHWQDPAVLQRIGIWTRAAAGWHASQSLRVARFGDNMRQVAVTEGDKVEAQLRLGFSVDGFGVGELEQAMAAASDAAVDSLIAEYEQLYEIAPELRRQGDRHAALRDAARIEAGLRAFLNAGSFGAFTDTFEDLGSLPQLPGLAVQRLMADGYGFGGEGDWKTAALVRIVKVMSAGLPGGTSFMEDYTYHLGSDGPKVLGAHMLEICPSITRQRARCEVHPLSIGGRSDPVRLVFTAEPGPAMIAALVDLGPRFRMITNAVEAVLPDRELTKLPVAHAVWLPEPDLATAAEAWIEAGGPHHTAFTQALPAEAFVDFAEIAGIELVSIDRDSTVRSVKHELRWNDAHHRSGGALS